MNERNDTWVYLAEYNDRKKLAELGFHSHIDELPIEKAEIFCVIASEIQRLFDDDMKNAKKGG